MTVERPAWKWTDAEVHASQASSIQDGHPFLVNPSLTVVGTSSGLQRVHTRTLDSVERRPIQWLWRGRIPLGMISLIDGNPGTNKSTMLADLGARITTGREMPESADPALPAAGVLLIAGEDHAETVLVGRYAEAGADLARVTLLDGIGGTPEGPGRATMDRVPEIESIVRDKGVRLVVVDPLAAHLPSSTDSYRDQDMRAVLGPLAGMAERTGCALVLVRHLTKGQGSALHKGGGSIGIAAAARSVLLVAHHPEDPESRCVTVTKSNHLPGPGLSFKVVASPDPDYPVVEWTGTVTFTSDDLATTVEDRDQTNDLATALTQAMTDEGGTISRKDAQAIGRELGASESTVLRALSRIATHQRRGSGRAMQTLWTLKDDPHSRHTRHLSERDGSDVSDVNQTPPDDTPTAPTERTSP